MYPEEIETPVPIEGRQFRDQEENSASRVTLAAFLLLAGPLFVECVAADQETEMILPREDLAEAGIIIEARKRVPQRSRSFAGFGTEENPASPRDLADLVMETNRFGDPVLAARTVAHGTRSNDELIRVCALGSAIEFFDPAELDIPGQITWFLRNAKQQQTFELLATLLARLWSPALKLARVAPPTTPLAATGTGLLTVHGTVLPYSQSNRPEWSVPPAGSLFKHLAAIRPDIYGRTDYFRWEGGYTDYAREVAVDNLHDWINLRGLSGVDVVAHSHGCNVVMGTTAKGVQYHKLVLMSCPVHWTKYNLPASMITKHVISVRVRLDLVILMDRGGQRFPKGTISEHILPLWYTGHSAATKPKTWQNRKLDRFVL